MKAEMAKETILTFSNYNNWLKVHTYASNPQLGGFVSLGGKAIASFSQRLNVVQMKHDKELFSIVKTLKDFK